MAGPDQVDWQKAGSILDEGGSIVGSVAPGVGMASLIRIPVPGTRGLAIELSPRGWTPKGGSTSTLFIQDIAGKRVLRLDYGFNIKTQKIDFHWNQKGTFQELGIADHTVAGRGRGPLQGCSLFQVRRPRP